MSLDIERLTSNAGLPEELFDQVELALDTACAYMLGQLDYPRPTDKEIIDQIAAAQDALVAWHERSKR
jgi:hypothetical protein